MYIPKPIFTKKYQVYLLYLYFKAHMRVFSTKSLYGVLLRSI